MTGFLKIGSTVNACEPLDPIYFDKNDADENDKHINQLIVFAERGSCTFVTKAFHAQAVGAKMLIIGNNREGETDFK